MSWLTTPSIWYRRKPKLVKGSTAGTQTDYQLKLTVYKGSGIDTVNTIYLGGYVNNDFSDLRFTSSDEITILPYWIESYVSGVSAIVWVKIDSIPADPFSKFIYIYYDNPVATTTSSANNTLVFFDDFESGTIDPNKWATQIVYGSMGIRTDKKYGAYSYGSDQGPGQGCCWPGYVNPDQNHYFMKLPDGNNIQYLISTKAIRWATTAWASSAGMGFGGNTVIYGIPSDNAWRNYDIILKRTSSSNINYQVAVNGVWEATADIAITQGTILPFGVQTMHFGPTDNSVYVRSDDFRVRKYTSPEPIWDETSPEQVYTANLTVSSVPIEAEIWINNIDQGVTTTGWFTLNPGTYTIMLTKPGYEDYIEIITLGSNQNTIVQGNLVLSEALITAISIVPSTVTCVESCNLTIDITWINNGNVTGTFEPALTIDGTRTGSGTNISLDPGLTHVHTLIVSDLMRGTHTICPDPN